MRVDPYKAINLICRTGAVLVKPAVDVRPAVHHYSMFIFTVFSIVHGGLYCILTILEASAI